MTPSKTLFYFCISFVAGISLQSAIKIPQMFLWGILIVGLLAIVVSFLFSGNNLAAVGFCILFLALGIARFQISEFNAANDKIRQFNDNPEKVVLTGQIADEPDVRDTSQKLKVKVDGSRSVVLVTTNRYPEYKYLDAVKVAGKLKTPADFEGFDYGNYLMKEGIYSVMDFPEAELIPAEKKRGILALLHDKILFFKGKMRESIGYNFYPPQSLILEGIILGNSRAMPQELKDKLSATGVRHLTAISGLHIVILSSILTSSLLMLGLWRNQAFYLAAALIWLYIAMVGFPPSGVRAGIMGTALMLAEKMGRQNVSGRVMVIAAAVMLLGNPFLLAFDVGFQLSFLAAAGIIYLKPAIESSLRYFAEKIAKRSKEKIYDFSREKPTIKYFSGIFLTTISAQIFTLPIIIYNFGAIPLVSPVTNLLILPAVPFLMFFGLLTAMAGIFSDILGFVFSLPAQAILSYLLGVVDVFYRPWLIKTVENVSLLWVFMLYAIITTALVYLKKYQEKDFSSY